jgi:ABC-2 type transport system ATP-binding protein
LSGELVYTDVTCRFDATASRTTPKRRAALDHFSLRAAPGEVTCLVGPNGAGKSTALAAAAGLMRVEAGAIEYRGSRVCPETPPSDMGYLPQTSELPNALTVGEVLEFSFAVRGTTERNRREVVELFGLDDKWREPVGTLSSGWTRRLGLAVALIPGSRLLLLDEPFVGLDLRVLDSLVGHLNRLANDGATLVLSSHDFEIVDLLPARIAVLDEGSLVDARALTGAGSRALYRHALDGNALPALEESRERVV